MTKKKALSTGDKTVLALSARGDCYNPSCNHPLVTTRDDRPIVQFEMAHIRDELPPISEDADIGWRYWPADDISQTERNHFSNLILLCKPCHTLIDKINPKSYPVELLHHWKKENEGMRGLALEESLGIVEQVSLNELIIEAIDFSGGYTKKIEQHRISKTKADGLLFEIRRYREIIDKLLMDERWVNLDKMGVVTGLTAMAHEITFEIVADTSIPSYCREAAIEARQMAKHKGHPSSPNKWAAYLQRDLKWEEKRIRECVSAGIDPTLQFDEPSIQKRIEYYDRAIKILDDKNAM